MKTLTNLDIIKYCNKYNIPLNGVFRIDNIIKGPPNYLTVVNSAIDNEISGHWIAYIYNDKLKSVYYIDSYGVSPFDEIINLFKGYKILYNNIQIQALNSNICGWVVLLYALFYFHYTNKKKAVIHFKSLFTPNYNNNEKIIETIFKKL